mmetsp:Transcript_28570/g.48595  ORF Transcript_28570/g.48595 Transcript_28570/m.48595 type:complete len:270 (-) Transcript_28570:261-1070(-)
MAAAATRPMTAGATHRWAARYAVTECTADHNIPRRPILCGSELASATAAAACAAMAWGCAIRLAVAAVTAVWAARNGGLLIICTKWLAMLSWTAINRFWTSESREFNSGYFEANWPMAAVNWAWMFASQDCASGGATNWVASIEVVASLSCSMTSCRWASGGATTWGASMVMAASLPITSCKWASEIATTWAASVAASWRSSITSCRSCCTLIAITSSGFCSTLTSTSPSNGSIHGFFNTSNGSNGSAPSSTSASRTRCRGSLTCIVVE